MANNINFSSSKYASSHIGFVKKTGGRFNTICEAISIILASIGIYFLVTCFYSNAWRQNTQRGLVIETIKRFAGIYNICTKVKGKISCEDLERFWGIQPPLILGGRIMLKMALTFSSVGLLLLCVGSKFTNFAAEKLDNGIWRFETSVMKERSFLLGGIFVFISGILYGGVVIWYAVRIMDNFWSLSANGSPFPGQKFAFGPGLYFYGWGGCALLIFSGFFGMVSSCCSRNYEDRDQYEESTIFGVEKTNDGLIAGEFNYV